MVPNTQNSWFFSTGGPTADVTFLRANITTRVQDLRPDVLRFGSPAYVSLTFRVNRPISAMTESHLSMTRLLSPDVGIPIPCLAAVSSNVGSCINSLQYMFNGICNLLLSANTGTCQCDAIQPRVYTVNGHVFNVDRPNRLIGFLASVSWPVCSIHARCSL